ncbi:MAG: DUF1365 domain-containing protein [Aeromicrobium erythreum]
MRGSSALPELPAIVAGDVKHARRTGVDHRFSHRVYQWLVDVDDLPRVPWYLRPFVSFRASDHVGDPGATIRENVVQLCADRGVDVSRHRIVMLANARVLGHVFDPLSVFWALDDDGTVDAIVAEVHNTYGERHAYLLRPDAAGRSAVDKAFYVSPFFDVEGRYDLRLVLGQDRVSTTIVLRHGDEAVFSASFGGVPRPATRGRIVRTLLSMPFMTHRVSLLIRIHGVWLWLRRLPIRPRPPHTDPVVLPHGTPTPNQETTR